MMNNSQLDDSSDKQQQSSSDMANVHPTLPATSDEVKKTRKKSKKKDREQRRRRRERTTAPASASLEISPLMDAAPVHVAHTAAEYDNMDAAIKSSLADAQRDLEAPIPTGQIDASHEHSKKHVARKKKNTSKKPELIEGDDEAPMPDVPEDAFYNDEKGPKRKLELVGENDSPTTYHNYEARLNEDATIKNRAAHGHSAGIGMGGPSSSSREGDIEDPNPQPALSTRPPTQPVLPQSGSSSATLEVAPLEATLVQGVEAELIVEEEPSNEPDDPVYEATIVDPRDAANKESVPDVPLPWWKRYQKFIVLGLVISVAALVALLIGMFLRSSPSNEEDLLPVIWTQVGQTIKGSPCSQLGRSVAVSGDGMIVAVGIPSESHHCECSTSPGKVRIYEWDASAANYRQRDEITGSGDFGVSLSISYDGIVLSVGSGSSQVSIYSWDEPQVQYSVLGIVFSNTTGYDEFGMAVSLSSDGKTLAVGDPSHEDADSSYWERGQVTVFAWNEESAGFEQLGGFIKSRYSPGLGTYLDLSDDGKILVLGGDQHFGSVYGWDESSFEYKERRVPHKSGLTQSGSHVGPYSYSAALSTDGKILAVGDHGGFITIGSEGTGGAQSGLVTVYEWNQESKEYIQLGEQITHAGSSVALSSDGRTIAVGAAFSDTANGENIGQVATYRYSDRSSDFEQMTFAGRHAGESLTGESNYDVFGASLEISADGRTLVVGAPKYHHETRQGGGEGYVKIYRAVEAFGTAVLSAPTTPNPTRQPTMKPTASPTVRPLLWTQMTRAINGVNEGHQFGSSVSISSDGTTIAIGADGYVRTYTTLTNSVVAFNAEQTIAEESVSFMSSMSLSANGEILAIGVPYTYTDSEYYGKVDVFQLVGGTSWRQFGNAITGDLENDRLGRSVVISADGKTLGVAGAGVRVYRLDIVNASYAEWKLAQNFPNGTSVGLSSDSLTLAVGFGTENSGFDIDGFYGRVRVYSFDVWSSKYELRQVIDGPDLLDVGFGLLQFGDSVVLSSDGNTLAVGTLKEPTIRLAPSVDVFGWSNSTGEYIRLKSFYGAGMKYSLSLDGKTVAIGDTQSRFEDDEFVIGRGEVTVYEWDDASSKYEQIGQTLIGQVDGTKFGGSLALSSNGKTLVVGASGNDENGENSGQVKVFTVGS